MPFAFCCPMLKNVEAMVCKGPSESPGSGALRRQIVLSWSPQNSL